MEAEIIEFVIRLLAFIAALCIALLVVFLLNWRYLRSMHLVLHLWRGIMKSMASKKLTPEQLNMSFVVLFFIATSIKTLREIIGQILKLSPSVNPVINDSILLFLLMLGSLWIVSWVEGVRIKYNKNHQYNNLSKINCSSEPAKSSIDTDELSKTQRTAQKKKTTP